MKDFFNDLTMHLIRRLAILIALLIVLGILLQGCLGPSEDPQTFKQERDTLWSLDEILNKAKASPNEAQVQALRVVPGLDWEYIYSRDTLEKYGFGALSMDSSNLRHSVVTDEAMRGWIAMIAQDSVVGGSTSRPEDTAYVYILSGQSNAHGRALNTSATAGELDASTTVQIYNRDSKAWEALNIGAGNNETEAGLHGFELGISENTPRNIYLIKHADGGKEITEWLPPGSPQLDTLIDMTIKPAINSLIRQGKIVYATFLWHQGEQDSDSEAEVFAYLDQLNELRDTLKNLLGGNLPFIAGTIREINTLDKNLNDRFRGLDGENFFRVIEIDWQDNYRLDNVHLNYDGAKAASLLYLAAADSLYPGLRIQDLISPRKSMSITSATPGTCSADTFNLTVDVSFVDLTSNIRLNTQSTDHYFSTPKFDGTASLLIIGLTCTGTTSTPIYAMHQSDTIYIDLDTYDAPGSSTIFYDFASGYTPPTTDAALFEDIHGPGHEIAIINSDTMFHQTGSGSPDNPYSHVKAVPFTVADVTVDFTLYCAGADSRAMIWLRADTTGGPSGHVINLRSGADDVFIYNHVSTVSYSTKRQVSLLQNMNTGSEYRFRVSEIGNLFSFYQWTGSSYDLVTSWTFTTDAIAQGTVMLGANDNGGAPEDAYLDDITISY